MNTIYVDDAIRDKFEAWNIPKPESFYADKNTYDLMLDAWQAATEQSQKEIAELKAREKVLVDALGTAQDELTHLSHHTREDYARDCVNKIFNSIEQALANVNNAKKG